MTSAAAAEPVRLVVDVANLLGSRPDGWWRDRAGATAALLTRVAHVVGGTLPAAGGSGTWLVAEVTVVLEGRAAGVPAPGPLRAVRATGSGDDALVAHLSAPQLTTTPGEGEAHDAARSVTTVVVTADRGLRSRLPSGTRVAGPGWLRDHLDRE